MKLKTTLSRPLSLLLSLVIFFDYSVLPLIAFGRDLSVSATTKASKLNSSAEDLDNMMKKLLDPGLPNIEKKRITGILFYHQPIYRKAVLEGKFVDKSPHVMAFLEQKKVMQADVIQRIGINYKNKYGHAPKQPIIPFGYNSIQSDDDIILGTGKTGRKLEPLYNEALNEVMQETVGRPMSADMRKKVDVNGLAWNMTQDAAHIDFDHPEKYINPQSGYANQRKLIEDAYKGKVTVYAFDDNGKMLTLNIADSVEEIKRLDVGKTLDIPGIDATRGSGSMSDFLRMAEKHGIKFKGKVTTEQIGQFIRNQKYSNRVIGDYTDILEAEAKLSKQYGDFIDLSRKLREATTIGEVASLLGSSYGTEILIPGGGVDYDVLTSVMMKHQNKQLSTVLPKMIAEVTSTEAYKIAKYIKTASKGNRLILRKQMALTYAPMTDTNIEKITKRIDKMPDIDVADKKFIKSIIKGDSRQIRRYAELLKIPTDELATRLKIDGDNIACTKWISSTTRYKPLMDAVTSRPGGSRFAAFLERGTAKALNLDIMLSPKAKASSKFMLSSTMILAATRAYTAAGSGEEGLKMVALSMFEMIPWVSMVLRFSEGDGKQAFKEFCMDVMPPLALANLAVMLGNYVAAEVKNSFTEDVKDGIARQVLRDLNDDDFIESDVPCYYMLKDREGMLQYLDDVSPGLGNIAKLASMIAPEIDALMSRHTQVDINNKALSTLAWFETISVGPYEMTFTKMFDLEQLKARVYDSGVPAIDELPPVQRVAAKLIVDNIRIRKEMYHEVIEQFMERIERLYNEEKEDCGEEWIQIVDETMKTIKSMYNNAPDKIKDSVFGLDRLKEEYRSIVEYLTAYDGEDKDLLELRKEMQVIIAQFREFIRKLAIVVDIELEGQYLDLQGHIFGGNQSFIEDNTIISGDRFRIGISARVSPIRKNLPWTVYYYAYNAKEEKIEKIATISLKPSLFNPGNEGLWPIDNPEKTTFFEFDKETSRKYFPEEQSYQIYPVIAFGSWTNPLAQVGYSALTNPADYPDLFAEDRAAFIGPQVDFSMIRPTIYADIKRHINKGEKADLRIALHVPLYAQDDEHKMEITSASYVEDSNKPDVVPDSHEPVSTDDQSPVQNPSISSISFGSDAKEGPYALTIKARIKTLDEKDQPLPKTIIINYINGEDNEKSGGESLADTAENLCNETKTAATSLFVKIQDNEKKFISFGDKLKNFFKKFKDLKKESKFVKTAYKNMEKKAAAIAEISHELEKVTLKICETTKQLNDHTKTDSEHDRNYDWINNKKERLKEVLDSTKNIFKDADLLEKESKKRLEAANLLKDTSQAALQKIDEDIEALRETNYATSMDELNKKAGILRSGDCPEDVFAALSKATKYYQKNQDKLKQITAFYKTIKNDFDKKVEEVESLDQVYQKTAYLLDLSKAYAERAENAAVKGAFCAVLAENIMKKVFIPDVRGIEINNAESRVSQKGLNVTRSELGLPPSDAEAGKVAEIIPGITKRVKKGITVTLSYYDQRPDRESQLANMDCSQWPGSQPVWDIQKDKPGCGCTGDMVWNQDNTKCISKIDAALADAKCLYPNSYAVWNPGQNRVVCDCIPGTVWNNDNSACIDSRQAALENLNCSQYPGTIPSYDNNGNLVCACPDGAPWIQNLNRCANQQDIAMANADCSQFPGTVPVWDAQNNKPACDCSFGTKWSQRMGKCINEQELAMANADCSHLPGSAPTWSYITNQVECECQSPYSRDLMTGKCVDWIAKAQRDNEAFNQEMERDRQAFDQRGNKANQNNNDSNLCNIVQGVDVVGIWDANGRFHSCLKGVNLTVGIPGKTNGIKADCPVSNWPPKFQRTRCSPVSGRCVFHFTALESKHYGPVVGYLKKDEEVCGYLY